MKTAFTISSVLVVLSVLPGHTQTIAPQNQSPHASPSSSSAFQIDGPGIRHPGRYQLSGKSYIPLYSALHLAGGFWHLAKQHEVCIVRTRQDKLVLFKLDATDQEVLQTFRIQAGDRVTVPAFRPLGDSPLFSAGVFRH